MSLYILIAACSGWAFALYFYLDSHFFLKSFLKKESSEEVLLEKNRNPPFDRILQQDKIEWQDLNLQLTNLEDAYLKILNDNEHLQLKNSEQLDEFLQISRELRTPLALLHSHTKMLEKRDNLEDDLHRDLVYLARNAKILLNSVDDLALAVQQEQSEFILKCAKVDVSHLVRHCAQQFLQLALERECSFTIEANEPLWLWVDVHKLERVVLNLLFNAFKLTPKKGHIRCSLRSEKKGMRLEVADSGPGILPENREEVFQKLNTVDGNDPRRFGGTGLSLSLSREFIVLHHGFIRCDESESGGAKFTVYIPSRQIGDFAEDSEVELDESGARRIASRARDELRAEAEDDEGILENIPELFARESSAHRGTLLLVEDNREMNRLIRRCLEDEYQVAWCHDEKKAFEKLKSINPDLVIFNASLSAVDDDNFVKKLRSFNAHRHTPVLVLTLPEDGTRRVQLLQSGAQDFLAKPFLIEELRSRVANLVTHKRVRDLLTSEVESNRNNLELIAKEVKVSLDETRVARDLAEHAKKVKENFLRIMSHELRTPITSMKISLRRLKKKGLVEFESREIECIADIEHGCRRLQETVDTIMEYARLESGRLRLKLKPIDLYQLLDEVKHDFYAHARQKNLDLTLTVIGQKALYSDPNIVRLLAVNLIGNAVKYTESGSVDIVAESSATGHIIEVRDTGRGISDEDLPFIFEPFEQLQSPRFEKGVGSGLGLAIVKQMVHALHGEIRVRSLLDGGSAFTVILHDFVDDKTQLDAE